MTGTFNAKSYWAERADAYRTTMDSAYHRNRLAMIDALLLPAHLTGYVLDFGCGDGVYAERVLRGGGRVLAVDIDSSMIRTTQQRLDSIGGEYAVRVGGVSSFDDLAAHAFDTVLALNVLAYLSGAEVESFYASASRVLRPGGVLVVTHSNELFDLYTLNKYTVAFFQRHFATHAPLSDIRNLLTYPEEPKRAPLPHRANPLSYRHTLERFGFEEQRQEFAILHPEPPLLTPSFDPDDIDGRTCPDTLHWPAEDRWKLMFMCSVFGSRAVRRVPAVKEDPQ